jgi:RNA polymerase sigma factor (sigma-70 family)
VIGTRPEGQTLVDRAAAAFSDFRTGDRGAFDDLVTAVTPLLWHTVRGQGVDPVAAEDVVQTVWMRLLHSAESVRDPQTVVKWLLTAARREAWRAAKRSRLDGSRVATTLDPGSEELTELPAQREAMPDEAVLRSRTERRLWHHVQDLSPRCRALLRVIAFADRPDYALIADSLGMLVGSIGPTRGRCLAKLRQQLTSDPQWEGREA